MKKLLLMFAAIAAMTFVACDTNANKEGENNENAFDVDQFTEALTTATDSATVADLLANANEEVRKLVETGDTEGAQTLLEKIKGIVETNKEKLTAIVPSIGTLVDQVVALPEGVKDVVNATGDSLKDAAVEAVTEKANEVVDAAKDAATEKVNEAVDGAKDKVNEAAKNAADEAKKKLGL